MKLHCPACGSPVEFRYDDSFVRVCDSCRSAIVRTDRGIETFGQAADLLPPASGLAVGDAGRYQGVSFVLSGRAQYAHPLGGSWEEWYLRFSDGRWGWLAQAQGQWALSFESSRSIDFPDFESIAPGQELDLGSNAPLPMRVGERSTAELVGAEGEIPFDFRPGSVGRFVDLGGSRGRFATIDYGPPGSSEAPTLYLGRRASMSELGLEPRDAGGASDAAAAAPATASGERLSCPNCGGSIELRLPGESKRVSCEYCGSLLDCEGPLSILSRQPPESERPPIALGARGQFDGETFTVTGRMRRRSSYAEGTGFFEWDEYLLHSPSAGYRWLAQANGHFTFVTPLAPGEAGESGYHRASLEGQDFALYDRAETEVVSVWGEFYWRVEVGETVQTWEYVAPPNSLSLEVSESEENWSLGEYRTPESVAAAFGLDSLADEREGVAGNQPFAFYGLGKVAVGLLVAFVAVALVRAASSDGRKVYDDSHRLSPSEGASAGGVTSVAFTPSFELSGPGNNVEVTLSMPVDNSWAYVTADLIHEESGGLRSFSSEISYYSGVSGGESWSEGSRVRRQILSAGESGAHLLRLQVLTPARPNRPLRVTVREDVFVNSQLGYAALALFLPALLLGFYRYSFEASRWSESDYKPAWMGSSDE